MLTIKFSMTRRYITSFGARCGIRDPRPELGRTRDRSGGPDRIVTSAIL